MNYYRILTYNLNWKNMEYREECLDNINRLINKKFNNKNIGDFIFLQEVANINKLLIGLDNNFNIIHHTSGKETMTTLINKKYNIIKTLGGQFVSGRPFLVILLDNNICLINVHFPHIKDIYNELDKIKNYLINNNINLDNFRIIIGGDFNIDIGKNINFMNKSLSVSKNFNTCCIRKEMEYMKIQDIISLSHNYPKLRFDHILDSDNKIFKTKLFFPHKNNLILPASDHLGIYCKLNL